MVQAMFRKSVLPSGITLLTEAMSDRRSVSVGVWVRNGARDEPVDLLGVSHFIEHMMFKGTERRDARAIDDGTLSAPLLARASVLDSRLAALATAADVALRARGAME